MINVVVTAGGDDSGRWSCHVEGHATREVCISVTAVQQTIATVLSELAAHYPDDVSFVFVPQEGPPPP